ncbi:sigma-E factor negative regulatory protein [Piscinibacter sp.]|uniref:sigma-E factor negative regulatory protein n=1 Tax=Piscinibacter sp. TaxID=1903157 RepID=UPI0039E37766
MSIEHSGLTAGGAERLSALVDGEVAADEVKHVCMAWRGDAQARQRWHTYQLIGDVLRSDDLASAPGRDEAFLQALRARLAGEPVVLAPQPAAPAKLDMAAGRSLRRWRTGMAVAAGFVVVAGALVAVQMPSGPSVDNAAGLAQAPAPAAPPLAVAAPAVPTLASAEQPLETADASADAAALVTDGRVIRDARLDRYLAAHQRFAGASALGVPSAFLRSATATADGAKR